MQASAQSTEPHQIGPRLLVFKVKGNLCHRDVCIVFEKGGRECQQLTCFSSVYLLDKPGLTSHIFKCHCCFPGALGTNHDGTLDPGVNLIGIPSGFLFASTFLPCSAKVSLNNILSRDVIFFRSIYCNFSYFCFCLTLNPLKVTLIYIIEHPEICGTCLIHFDVQ